MCVTQEWEGVLRSGPILRQGSGTAPPAPATTTPSTATPPSSASPAAIRHSNVACGLLEEGERALQHAARAGLREAPAGPHALLLLLEEHGLLDACWTGWSTAC